MIKKYPIALHIFRRDLRIHDNTALIAALQSANTVIPCFIFDKRQIDLNEYKSANCIQFMLSSLSELDTELRKKQGKLAIFYGIAEDIVALLLKKTQIAAVYINRDYTPFSRQRDQLIENVCRQSGVDFHCYADALLHEPEVVLKSNGKPYTVFTYAFKKAQEFTVASPQKCNHTNYYQKIIPYENNTIFTSLSTQFNPNIAVQGGRREALALLKQVLTLSDYNVTRAFPGKNSTSKLSAHNKFGTLSIREFYSAITAHFGESHTLIRELYWRDFFTHIGFHYPHVFGASFYQKYDNLTWDNNKKYFHAWCQGQTGYPIVDAGMRELNETGYMHNRVRMITASFLTKNLHIDWRWGEKYFAQKLVDYDPAVNNGNWQWAASTGCDAQPYFRIFNPWLQQKKFDFDCSYIKRWVSELSTISPKHIHQLFAKNDSQIKNYPAPIVGHATESKRAKAMYKIVNQMP